MSGMIGSASKTLRVKEFRASGTFTVPDGVKTVELFLGGGGAGGNSTAGGGNPGRIVETKYDVYGKASCAVVIGAGGIINSEGGNSSFDGVVIAEGGRSAFVPTNGPVMVGVKGFGGVGADSNSQVSVNGAKGPGADAPSNSCAGGARNHVGGSGYCRVEWYE